MANNYTEKEIDLLIEMLYKNSWEHSKITLKQGFLYDKRLKKEFFGIYPSSDINDFLRWRLGQIFCGNWGYKTEFVPKIINFIYSIPYDDVPLYLSMGLNIYVMWRLKIGK